MTVPGDRSLSARAVAGTFLALAWIAVSLRCYVRIKIVKSFGKDDWFMVMALSFYTMFCACMITASFYGTGKHEANLSEAHIVIALRLWWLCEVSYCLTSVAVKASICLFLLRITVRRLHIWILYSVMVVTIFAGIVFMLVLLLQCHPVTYFWNKDQSGHCISWTVIIAMSWVWSVFAATCDFTVGIVPVFLVWGLKMDTRTKVAVVSILGLACIASCAVIVRFPFLHTFSDPDFLWATTDIALWTNIEVGLGIFASSLATLRPLIRVVKNNSQQGYTDDYQLSDRLRPNYHNSRISNALKRSFGEHSTDRTQEFRPPRTGITLTTVHTTARGVDGNNSDEYLNEPHQTQNTKQEFLVQKTFEVTTTERMPSERDSATYLGYIPRKS